MNIAEISKRRSNFQNVVVMQNVVVVLTLTLPLMQLVMWPMMKQLRAWPNAAPIFNSWQDYSPSYPSATGNWWRSNTVPALPIVPSLI